MFNNLSTMLNSLDSIAQENLQEPKLSAKSLRQQKKDTTGGTPYLDSFELSSSAVSSHRTADVSANNSESSFVVVDESDNHSDNALSPKSGISTSSLIDYAATSVNLPEKHNHENSLTYHLTNPSQSEGDPPLASMERESKQIIIAKNKEIEKLNRECLDLETQNEGLKQEVREAWAAYKSAQEKAALREADYQEDISQLEKAKSSDRAGMTLHVKNMEKELENKSRENENLRSERDRLVKLHHSLQEDSKDWISKKEDLESRLRIADAKNDQSLEGLREELRHKESCIEALQREHSNVMRKAHQRHDDLEQVNSDLTATLMTREREVTRLLQQQQQIGSGRNDAANAEIEKLQMQLEQVSNSLLEEQISHQDCQRRLRASAQEVEVSRSSWEDEKRMLLARISQLSSVDSSSSNQDGSCSRSEEDIRSLEEQVHCLGRQLLRKQESLEEYLSERAALKVRLQDSQRRCQKYEEQINELLASQDPYDYESNAGIIVESNRSESGNLRKRGPSSNDHLARSGGTTRPLRVSQDLQKFGVHASPGVSKAVDMIDTWTLVTGKHLKAFPLLRFIFVLYLFIIHAWAFCLLAYHVHALDIDEASDFTNKKLG